jgi:hypothetical protein
MQSMPGPRGCAETAGFLFSHACKNPPIQICSTCQKPICAAHSRSVHGMPTCVGCSRAQGGTGQVDDPYDYSTRWYGDYRDYDRWDRYRRPAASGTAAAAASATDSATPAGTGFSADGGASWDDGATPAGTGFSADGGASWADDDSAAKSPDGFGGPLDAGKGWGDAEAAGPGGGIGGPLDDSGWGSPAEGGVDDGWESDFDAS